MASPAHERLPARHSTHQLEAFSKQRFRTLFCEPLFLVRDESAPDYGADLSIEALVSDGKRPTNIRRLIQLKATSKAANVRGVYKINIKIHNIHYMINSHSSFYCAYSAQADRLYYRSSMSVFEELQQCGRIPSHKRFLSVGFWQELDTREVAEIHRRMLEFAEGVKAIEQLYASDDYGEVIFGKYRMPPEPHEVTGVYACRLDEFGNLIRLEHELWLHAFGSIPRGYEVFHKNGMMLDNRRINLGLRPVDPRKYSVGIFPTLDENINARNILRVILQGEEAKLEEAETPEPAVFWDVVRALQKQGMSMMRDDVEAYKSDCRKLLRMDL